MKTIHLQHPYDASQIEEGPVALALGFFDGIHKGHQKVIKTARQLATAKHLKLAVMSFDEHPSILFKGIDPNEMKYLSPLERKEELLATLGVDVFYVVSFTREFASLTPQAFVDQYICGLQADLVVAGFDYTYGKHDVANMSLLDQYAKGRFEIVTIPEQRNRFGKIGSTQVRDALIAGDIALANQYLGYAYELRGEVVHGFGRGSRMLGFPTANIAYEADAFLPGKGVYVVEMQVGDEWHLGMASIGLNPTFEDVTVTTIEVNVLDFDADIYGQEVRVDWHAFLRPEVKFDGIEALIAQLHRDEEATRAYFEAHRHEFKEA